MERQHQRVVIYFQYQVLQILHFFPGNNIQVTEITKMLHDQFIISQSASRKVGQGANLALDTAAMPRSGIVFIKVSVILQTRCTLRWLLKRDVSVNVEPRKYVRGCRIPHGSCHIHIQQKSCLRWSYEFGKQKLSSYFHHTEFHCGAKWDGFMSF